MYWLILKFSVLNLLLLILPHKAVQKQAFYDAQIGSIVQKDDCGQFPVDTDYILMAFVLTSDIALFDDVVICFALSHDHFDVTVSDKSMNRK